MGIKSIYCHCTSFRNTRFDAVPESYGFPRFSQQEFLFQHLSMEVNSMDLRKYCSVFLSIIASISLLSTAWAGQVVTDDIREWAKQSVKNEKSMESVTSANTLAVLYFRNLSGREELAPLQKGLSLMLITDLSIVKDLQVVERARLQALTEEMGLGDSGLVEQGTAPRVGKLLGARRLVGGDIAGAGQERIQLKSTLLDVPTTAVIGQQASEGLLDELFRMEKDLLFDIVKLLKIEVTPEMEAKLRKPCSTKTDALLALFTGVDASDRKDYEKAAESYRKALMLDSNICVANDALGELHALGLISQKKRSGALLKSLRDDTSLTNQLTPKDELRNVRTPKDVPANTDIRIDFPTNSVPARR
jgi:TolB-like protein